jgi:hypothetical protein
MVEVKPNKEGENITVVNGIQQEAEEEKEKRPVGRPSCYREIYPEQAYKLALLGATDKELADFFGVCEDTINNWKKQIPEFFESIKRGKIQADAEVADKLFKRATGYEHPEEKIFCQEGEIIRADTTKHYPPDTGAAFIWLKNRRMWTDRADFTSGGEKIAPVIINYADAIKKGEVKETNDNSS